MFGTYQTTEELTQNLIEVGCNEEMIADFLFCLLHGDKAGGLCRLETQRVELLDEIHKEQSCIEFLDGLLRNLRNSSNA